VPYTVQRIEYEEVVEQIPVKVCRYVNETKAVQVPRTVSKLVPYQTTRLQPRIVTMRVPIGGYETSIYEGPTTRYYYGTPVQAVPAAPSKQSVLRSPVQAPTAPQGVLRPESNGATPNGAAPNGATTKRVEPNQAPQKTEADESPSDRAKEEADRAPALPLNPPEGSARHTSTDRQA
jgi:hypothetical protein